MASRAQLHCELIAFLRQHCPVRDQRHLVLLAWMVAGLLLSETVCFDRWNAVRKLPDQPVKSMRLNIDDLRVLCDQNSLGGQYKEVFLRYATELLAKELVVQITVSM